jgi:glycosyltransferase involved in cell wall biosynthesis
MFAYPENGQKKLQIAYMPRKRAIESVFLKGLFASLYPEYKEVPWVEIEDMTREACAKTLQESAVFAALGFSEGLGLPPLEAMACGCIVAGFDGLGGCDYTHPENGFWAKEGDYFEYVHQLALALKAASAPRWSHEIRAEAQRTLKRYHAQSFRNSLLTAWKELLGEQYDEYLLGTN